MSTQRRGRSESIIKIIKERKESKLLYYEAVAHNRSGNYEKAVNAYSRALELNPREKNALVARSQCYILMGQTKLALADAEDALTIDKSYIRAIYQKAETLYNLGEFEHSLVYYHRGLRTRPDLEGFWLGIHKAQQAIENAIGTSMIKNASPTERSPDRHLGSRTNKVNSKFRKSNDNRLKQMPKQLCLDTRYLKHLLKHPDIKCCLLGDTDLPPKIKEAIDYLETRQQFWKQQLPPKYL